MRRENAHVWLAEPLMEEPSFMQRPMFGCEACYVRGLLALVFADQDPPWNGVLIATDRDRQAALQELCPELVPHPVLGKWLYIAAEHDRFERVVQKLVRLLQEKTALIGVEPDAKRAKSPKKRSVRRSRIDRT